MIAWITTSLLSHPLHTHRAMASWVMHGKDWQEQALSKIHIFCTEGILIKLQTSIPFRQFKEITPCLHQATNLHMKASSSSGSSLDGTARPGWDTPRDSHTAEITCGYLFPGSTLLSMASTKAAVLPVPDCDCAMRFCGLGAQRAQLRGWSTTGAPESCHIYPCSASTANLTSYALRGRNFFLPNTLLWRFSIMEIWKESCGYLSNFPLHTSSPVS